MAGMVVLMPIVPVAMPINIAREVHDTKAQKQLQDVLDPVYEKRITMIQDRDPIADAKQTRSGGTQAFLPSWPGGSLFPGLENTQFNLNKEFGSENYARLQQSEFLRYLETLMSEDPVQVQHKNVPYFSETYKRFIHVCWNYRAAFNLEMWRLYVPDKSLPAPAQVEK